MNTALRTVAPLLILSSVLAACTTPDAPVEIFDPYEKRNRKIHSFNVSLDRNVVRPAAQAYGTAVPRPVRKGVSNLADFLSTPGYMLNDIAQGNIEDAGHNFTRLMLNAVFGFGLLDTASAAGMDRRPADFGETLFTWGVPEGAYIERPILGPSTERDTIGAIVDIVTNPTARALDRSVVWVSPGTTIGNGLNTRYERGDVIDDVLYESTDSYAQARSLYLQNRRFELGQDDDFAFDPYRDRPDE